MVIVRILPSIGNLTIFEIFESMGISFEKWMIARTAEMAKVATMANKLIFSSPVRLA